MKLAIAGLLMALAGAVGAQQEYPTKPVRIVVPYPPGASNDFLARLFAPKLTELLGVQVLVDNRGGGNTVIGNDLVAKSAPDGYTLLLAGSSQISIPHLYRTLPYDSINDFSPVAGIARSEFMLVVHPSLPVATVKDLVALAKKKPGAIDYASSSTGGGTHLAAVQFEMVAGVKLQQVAYKGGGPAIVDLLGGHVQVAFANPATAVPLVRTGRLRGLAITGDKRLESLPQVPTFTESGLPGLAHPVTCAACPAEWELDFRTRRAVIDVHNTCRQIADSTERRVHVLGENAARQAILDAIIDSHCLFK